MGFDRASFGSVVLSRTQAVGTGMAEYLPGLLRRGNVAVGEHRDPHPGFDLGDGVVLRLPVVLVLTGTAVNGQGLDPGLFRHPSDDRRVAVFGAPAGAHFQGHGHIHRLHHRRLLLRLLIRL